MQTKLREAEKKVLAVEWTICAACWLLCAYAIYMILHGSLWAPLWMVVPAYIACVTGDDAQRIITEAKRRDGND